jgi:hypothetical protein
MMVVVVVEMLLRCDVINQSTNLYQIYREGKRKANELFSKLIEEREGESARRVCVSDESARNIIIESMNFFLNKVDKRWREEYYT